MTLTLLCVNKNVQSNELLCCIDNLNDKLVSNSLVEILGTALDLNVLQDFLVISLSLSDMHSLDTTYLVSQ